MMNYQIAIDNFKRLHNEIELALAYASVDHTAYDNFADRCEVLIDNYYPFDGEWSPFLHKLKKLIPDNVAYTNRGKLERLRDFIKNNMLSDLSIKQQHYSDNENENNPIIIESNYHKEVTKKQNVLIENLNGIIKDQQHKIEILSKVKNELETLKANARELNENHANEIRTIKDHHTKYEAEVQTLIKSALKTRLYNTILLLSLFSIGNIYILYYFEVFNWLIFNVLEFGIILCFIIFHNKKSRELINSVVGVMSMVSAIIFSLYSSGQNSRSQPKSTTDTNSQAKYDSLTNRQK